MSTENIRAILALLIVGVFMIITAFMALYPLLTPQQVQLNDYADFFAKTSSVYTGIIGVIVGYYFGRPMISLEFAKLLAYRRQLTGTRIQADPKAVTIDLPDNARDTPISR